MTAISAGYCTHCYCLSLRSHPLSALQLAEASHMRAVHQAAHSEIERFDRSWLQHVEPVVKQTLPDGRSECLSKSGSREGLSLIRG